MLKTLLEKQKHSLNHFFSTLDMDRLEKVFEKLRSCSGVVILSGVGKSGHIAQKVSTTLISTGTRSSFLCPAHALHGDLGFVTSQDVVLLFSKSGESRELIELMPHLQKRRAYTISAVCRQNSHLAQMADLSIELPMEKELCPYDLAPTTSTAVQLLFGDCLAIALMEDRRFTVQDFASNHPAGFLGRKITLKVADLMVKEKQLPVCKLHDRLIDQLHELSAKKCGCLLVCDDNFRLKGMFTDGDLRRAIEARGSEALRMRLSELMTLKPLTISPQILAIDAMREMEKDPARLVTVLPVLEGERLVGLLRMHDIVQAGL